MAAPSIPFFNLALIAVRAIALVKAAEDAGQVAPKNLALDELHPQVQPPSSAEIEAVAKLQHFARTLALYSLHVRVEGIEPRDPDIAWPDHLPTHVPELPGDMEDWCQQIHKAVYLSLIVTASLTGAYSEPLYVARGSGDDEIERQLAVQTSRGPISSDQLHATRLYRFLEGFTVCRTVTSPEEERPVFGILADWLIRTLLSDDTGKRVFSERFAREGGRGQYCCSQERIDQSGLVECPVNLTRREHNQYGHVDAHFVVWQIMQVLWVTHMIATLVFNERPDQSTAKDETRVEVHIIRFATFKSELITMPSEVAYDEEQMPRLTSPSRSTTPALSRLFVNIRDYSGQPNHYSGESAERSDVTLPLHYKFFEHLLREYVGLRLRDGACPDDPGGEYHDTWDEFIGSLGIFYLDKAPKEYFYWPGWQMAPGKMINGAELLASSEPPPTFHFCHVDYADNGYTDLY